MKLYIVIENTKESFANELEILPNPQNDGYVRSEKYNLQELIPSKLYIKLVKNGLFELETTGFNGNNSPYGIHRLIMCLYNNCINNRVHHIDLNRSNNIICNLINGSKTWHDTIHNKMNKKEGLKESKRMQDELKRKLFKKDRNTLSNNLELIQEIFRLRAK